MPHPRALLLPLLAVGAMLLATPDAGAQELSNLATRRAVRAAVKITASAPGGPTSSGSGSIIDPRGYVLTNFHVVGHTRPGHGTPGALISPDNRVEIAMVTTARDRAQPRYQGKVVRADTRLDLALIRIIADNRGAPLPRGTRFPAVQLARTDRLRPGSRVFAFGFPLGVRTINVTSGEMSGFQLNSRDEVSWIRTNAEFNPGNSGGMLLDRRGRLVAVPTAVYSDRGTLEPIELARPVERVPTAWRRDLRRGHLDDLEVVGVPELALGADLEDEAVGDGGAINRPELHYYRLPAGGSYRVELSPALSMGLLTRSGDLLREGQGRVEVRPTDPPNLILGVLIPPRGESGGGTLVLRLRVREAQTGPTGWGGLPPPGQPGHPAGPPSSLSPPSAAPRPPSGRRPAAAP
ncbi:MAG: S1C family serine protease [Sandaracinaceae bacterium]